MIKNLPPNTVERLSNYRRKLLLYNYNEKPFIHSHSLAHLLKINPAHVRRDLMLIGFAGDVHKGYDIKKLIEEIAKAIQCERIQKVGFIGIGEVGRAVAEAFIHENSRLKVAATFRVAEEPKIQFSNVQCFNISKMKSIIKKEGIEIIVLALPNGNIKEIYRNKN